MKMVWANGSFSDPITILNVYQQWQEQIHSGRFKPNQRNQTEKKLERKWANNFYIEIKALKVIEAIQTLNQTKSIIHFID